MYVFFWVGMGLVDVGFCLFFLLLGMGFKKSIGTAASAGVYNTAQARDGQSTESSTPKGQGNLIDF